MKFDELAPRAGQEARDAATGLQPPDIAAARTSRRRRNAVTSGLTSIIGAVAIVGAVAIWPGGGEEEPTSPPQTMPSIASVVPADAAVGGSGQGFVDVENALATARTRWHDADLQEYGYRLVIDCDCVDVSNRWVRVFGDDDRDDDLTTVEQLFDRIAEAVAEHPNRLEVAFSGVDGHPISYDVTTASGEMLVTVKDFHPIALEATPFDGTWRFVVGTVDARTFRSPPTGGISLMLLRGGAQYHSDCNRMSHRVDIYEGSFEAGGGVTTAAGCSVYSDESALFETAFSRSDSIRLDGSDLVLNGAGVELRFTPPQEPDTLGEPLLTAAGERLSFEVPDGRDRLSQYIITSSMEDPTRGVLYLLTADTPGSAASASWQLWAGEPDEPTGRATGPGPDTVVIPDSIRDGDYGLCSPYWEPGQFCFTLQVRPASAPWIITAGHDGVVLHDRNGTSKALTTVASRIAFYVAGRLIIQPEEQPEMLLIVDAEDVTSEIPLRPGESLFDVALLDGRTRALTSDPSGTFILDIDTGSWVPVGPAATDARFAGTVILVRTLTDTLRIIQPDGTVIWERQLDPETMVVPDHDGHLRLDTFGVLNTDAAPEPYFQYLTTELVDLTTGETVDTYEREIAIPDEGQQIAEPCLRAEFQGSLLLCPQPDGRIMTLEVDGGDSRTLVPNATTATYARPISQ